MEEKMKNNHDIVIREVFQKSRADAVLKCAEVMVDLRRKDIAKLILSATHIDREKLAELKKQDQ